MTPEEFTQKLQEFRATVSEKSTELEGKLGPGGYELLGVVCFLVMGAVLLRVARRAPSGG